MDDDVCVSVCVLLCVAWMVQHSIQWRPTFTIHLLFHIPSAFQPRHSSMSNDCCADGSNIRLVYASHMHKRNKQSVETMINDFNISSVTFCSLPLTHTFSFVSLSLSHTHISLICSCQIQDFFVVFLLPKSGFILRYCCCSCVSFYTSLFRIWTPRSPYCMAHHIPFHATVKHLCQVNYKKQNASFVTKYIRVIWTHTRSKSAAAAAAATADASSRRTNKNMS